MKPNLAICGIVILSFLTGCNGELPTTPLPAPPDGTSTGSVSGNVYAKSGGCLVSAVVEVLDGPRAGARVTQTVCQSPWDYGDDGYTFTGLPANSTVRLRASREGYQSQERTFPVVRGSVSQSNFELMPE